MQAKEKGTGCAKERREESSDAQGTRKGGLWGCAGGTNGAVMQVEGCRTCADSRFGTRKCLDAEQPSPRGSSRAAVGAGRSLVLASRSSVFSAVVSSRS